MTVLEGQRRRRPGARRNWSLISDAARDRPEGLATRAVRARDQAAFLANLDAHDRIWLTALRARLGIEQRGGTGT